MGFFDRPTDVQNVETDESVDEDDLDFWGRDEPRSITSGENIDDEMDDDEESDEDSAMEDCDDDEEEDGDDEFELLGHR